MNLNEYSLFPTNPQDGDVYRDEKGIQWAYISEVKDWGMDLRDENTREWKAYFDGITGNPVDSKEGRNTTLQGDELLRYLREG